MPRPLIGDRKMTPTERSRRYNQATKERIAGLEAEVMRLEGILTVLAAKAQTGNVTADDVMAHVGRWLLQSR
jgi:hypothetical protein